MNDIELMITEKESGRIVMLLEHSPTSPPFETEMLIGSKLCTVRLGPPVMDAERAMRSPAPSIQWANGGRLERIDRPIPTEGVAHDSSRPQTTEWWEKDGEIVQMRVTEPQS